MLNVKRGNVFTKFGFPAKDNGIDETTIRWCKIKNNMKAKGE